MDFPHGDEAALLMRQIGGSSMSAPSRLRFTLGQLMVVIAGSAVFFAAATFSLTGQYMYLVAFSYLTSLAGVVVLLYNVRFSGWMWFALAGWAGPMLSSTLLNFASAMSPSVAAGHIFLTVHLALNSLFSILVVLGLAITFRDLRRRLASREDEPRSSSAEPANGVSTDLEERA
jgi:hypothetical protein